MNKTLSVSVKREVKLCNDSRGEVLHGVSLQEGV